MRKLILAIMLSVLLFGFGTAHAILGANDAVPGQDVVFPIICEGNADGVNPPTFGTLNTLWAIAEVRGGPKFPDSTTAVKATLRVFDVNSVEIFDAPVTWTPLEVAGGPRVTVAGKTVKVTDCAALVALMSPAQAAELKVTLNPGAKSYFAGYLTISGQSVPENGSIQDRFTPWVYLVDLPKGFASGFNGVSVEEGLGSLPSKPSGFLGENADANPVSAASLYPRYFMLNNLSDTFNWWIVLAGENETHTTLLYNVDRVLSCQFCNEDETCISQAVPIPNELNIINVADFLPPGLHSAFPKAGFAACDIVAVGTIASTPVVITGTVDLTNLSTSGLYSIYGWSYQRQMQSQAQLSWDVIHEMHRDYCSTQPDVTGTTVGTCAVQ